MELRNGQEIAIHLETSAVQGKDKADFVLDVSGQLVKIGDTLYIRYVETAEDGITEIPVTIKVEPEGFVQIMRGKALHSRLKFEYQKKVAANYRTEYGIFQMESFTHQLHFSLKDQPLSGSLVLVYDLFVGEDKIGSYQMKLEFLG